MAEEILSQSTIDTRDFVYVAKALKKASPAMRLELLRSLKAAGEIIAADAREIIAPYSETIPPTIKTRVRGVGVSVQAGGGENAIAGLFELGNKGKGKSAASINRGVFRHPTFGNMDNWQNQPMHPYLIVAGEKNRGAVDAAILKALDAVTKIIVLDK